MYLQKKAIERLNRMLNIEAKIYYNSNRTKLQKKIVGPGKLPLVEAVFHPEELKEHH